jgi:N-methylhydantoinase A
MATRIGVDVGGTFTDLVLYDDVAGEVRVAKGSSTPSSPDRGLGEVVSGAVPAAVLGRSSFFLHATTIGINALLERNGAVVGLLTTRGFRDVLETRRGDRDAMYDLLWKAPPPLVPRRLRLPVTGRIRADGSIESAFDEDDVREATELFAREGVESVAVVFINAYANPEHECAAEIALRKFGFEGEISLSHSVSGEYREYERSSTTVIDAYVRPRVSTYLRRVEETLNGQGFRGEFLITRAGGGAMTFQEAEARPFETIMSGPIAGAMGAAELSRELEIEQSITADVGGTSFDTCLIVAGRPQVKYEGRVASMPLQTPWVDVRSIGAGGGSIAYIDAGGMLRVGPQSAGADPGPICYGRGGTNVTVTDAAAALGMLALGELAGGIKIDFTRARKALATLGRQLGLAIDELAGGIVSISTSAMANAIRSVTVEQGQDPRTAKLIVFGGAGPLFGTLLARELEIRTIVVPKYAGAFSAWGLLSQDVTRSIALTSIERLGDRSLEEANRIVETLFARLERRGTSVQATSDEEEREVGLDLRYTGQEYTLTINPRLENGRVAVDAEAVHATFTREYERTFGHVLEQPVETVAIRATTRRGLPRMSSRSPLVADRGKAAEPFSLDAYSFAKGKRVSFSAVGRASLAAGSKLAGPAIVFEETATTYIDAGFEVEVHPSGTLLISDLEVG